MEEWARSRRKQLLESVASRVASFVGELARERGLDRAALEALFDIGIATAAATIVDLPDGFYRAWRNDAMQAFLLPSIYSSITTSAAVASSRVIDLRRFAVGAQWVVRKRLWAYKTLSPKMTVIGHKLIAEMRPRGLSIAHLQAAGLKAVADGLAAMPYDLIWATEMDDLDKFVQRLAWQAMVDLIDDQLFKPPSAA